MTTPFVPLFQRHAHQDGPDFWSDPVLPEQPSPVAPAWSGCEHRPVDQRLIDAVIHTNLAAMEQALLDGANPNVQDVTDGSVLRMVLKPRHHTLPWDPRPARLLLEAGADPRFDERSSSVALLAWQYSHNAPGAMALTRWLVNHPLVDITQSTGNGSCMISLAMYAPNLLADLVRRGENPNRFVKDTSALGAALSFGVTNEVEVVRAFAAVGADPNAGPAWGRPALPYLLGKHDPLPSTVDALLGIGANPYWTGSQGETETLDDLLAMRGKNRGAIHDLLVQARCQVDNQRLREVWRDEIVPDTVRARSRL